MLVKIAVQLGMRKFHVALSIQTAMGWSSSENCKGMRSGYEVAAVAAHTSAATKMPRNTSTAGNAQRTRDQL